MPPKKRSSKHVDLASWLTSSIPPVLWHYTSFEGFRSIVEKQCIFSSDLRFLNDRHEMKHGLQLTRKILNKLSRGDSRTRDLLKAFEPWLLQANTLKHSNSQVFVTSFTAAKDRLSQWRAYAHGSTGVSLGFDCTGLREVPDPFVFKCFAPCVYEMQDKVSLLQGCLELLLGHIKLFLDETAAFGLDKRAVAHDNWLPILKESAHTAQRNLIQICALCKNRSFSEEGEWRFAVPLPQGVVTHAIGAFGGDFRSRNDTLVPHINLQINGDSRGPILTHVMLGPGAHRSAGTAVEDFLSHKLPGKQIRITKSKIPYRAS